MSRPVLKFYEGDENSPPRVTGVPVFREGDYSPQGKYTAAQVQELADTYDPDFLEAPLTPDHLQDGPAWGWWERFYTVNTAQGLELFGDCKLLFIGEWMWKSGMYKRRSIEFYHDLELPSGDSAFYVKAVSLLGAATPAVKGLQNMFGAVPKTAKVFGMPAHVDFKGRKSVKVKHFSVDSPEIETVNPLMQGFEWAGGQPVYPPFPQGMQIPFYGFNNLPNVTANDERTEPEMDPKENKKPEAGNFVQVDAKQFADMQDAMKQMTDSVAEFKQQAESFKKQAEETQKQLAAESESRKAAEATAFQQAEDKRFNETLEANKDRVTPAVAKRLRTLFHACPPDTETDRHVSFKDGANDRTLSMRGLILECMSAGGTVIDLSGEPESDNAGAETKNTGKVPTPDTKEFSDRVDLDARKLLAESPDKFKTYSEAADEAYRSLMRLQPEDRRGTSAKRRAIPKA